MKKILRSLYNRLRSAYIEYEMENLRNKLARHGDNFAISYPFEINGAEFVTIGSNVYIGPRVLIGASKEADVVIEDSVIFGPDVKVINGDHRYDLPDVLICDSGPGNHKRIIIEKGAWIGAASIILKGVTVGEGAILGAGSVLTKDIPPFEIWAGNPAKFIKKRF